MVKFLLFLVENKIKINKDCQPILITGGTGMIGINLVEKLVAMGIKPNVIYRDKKKLIPFSSIKNKINFIKLDLFDQKKINKTIEKIKPKTIFHLASSYFNPPDLNFNDHINSNFLITLNLLLGLKNNNTKNFVYTNTAAIYGSGSNIEEKSEIKCQSGYALSKNITSELIKKFSLNYNFFYKELRIFSVYGKWEKKHRLVCGAILKAIKKKKYTILSSNQIRDYLNVEDVINAILVCVNIKKKLLLNVCSGKSQKTHELVKKIFKQLNCRASLISVVKNDTKSKVLTKMTGNNKKINKILKWKPEISLDLGLNNTIKWLKINKNVVNT